MKKKILIICNVDWFFLSHRLPVGLRAIEKGYEVHLAVKLTDLGNKLSAYGFKVHSIGRPIWLW